jgi:hypothetical protein
VFVGDTLEAWLQPRSSQHGGLLVKRPFHGRFDEFQAQVDEAVERFGDDEALCTTMVHDGVQEDVLPKLQESVGALLAQAVLPAALGDQIRRDAFALGPVVASLCPSASSIDVKLEILGENSCARWHQDRYVARAIVSYSGSIGTEYTSHANVDFWELYNCGHNECVIRDVRGICSVDVGDFFFIKGTKFPTGANGLVHKSPMKRYHADGRVVNRLLLKLDVDLPQEYFETGAL